MCILFALLFFIFCLMALYLEWQFMLWEIGAIVYLLFFWVIGVFPFWAMALLLIPVIVAMLIYHHSEIKSSITEMILSKIKHTLPKISKTEEEALSAGDTWIEQDIFRGTPDWSRLHSIDKHELSAEEQSFLDQETHQLCAMLDEWAINQSYDMPKEVWDFMRNKGFFGLVIDKKYGGKGFSAKAHSNIVLKVASRSGAAAVTVMVPNSLGPGELLHHYGTEDQKQQYLPKLADGTEIPCFALTEPEAGSDATSIKSEAVVIKKKIKNKEVLGLNITLNKRWITLAPVASLIGLAVNLKDPDGLLNGVGEEGITCVLIPRNTKNLVIGNRHLPASQAFMNGTIRGKDIFVPIEQIIGGQQNAGAGWRMLVECLSIGRSISLPALGTAVCSVSYLTSGAYSRLRRQFGIEIGKFEGVEEKLAMISGLSYLTEATRQLTVAAVDAGLKPSVASAITKYHNTEHGRMAVNAAMDIHAGRGVVNGPRNYLSNAYQAAPISITVEGANIMTRNLLIFGQGSMACHPFVRQEFYALASDNKPEFDKLLWQHITYMMKNFSKMVVSAFTGGYFIKTPNAKLSRYYQRVSRMSYALAFLSDFSLTILGGSLKRKERLSARLGDGLAYLYQASAVLKYFDDNGENPDDLSHARWALDYCLHHAQASLIGLLDNFPLRFLAKGIKFLCFPFGHSFKRSEDELEHTLAKMAMTANQTRARFKQNTYASGDHEQPIGRVEQAFEELLKSQHLYKKIGNIDKLKQGCLKTRLEELVEQGEITEEEKQTILVVERHRWEALQVDEFLFDAMKGHVLESQIDKQERPV